LCKAPNFFVFILKLKMIELRTKYKKNQLNWITIEKVMHQTNNKGQCCQQPKLHGPCDKNFSHYKPLIQDPTSQSQELYV